MELVSEDNEYGIVVGVEFLCEDFHEGLEIFSFLPFCDSEELEPFDRAQEF